MWDSSQKKYFSNIFVFTCNHGISEIAFTSCQKGYYSPFITIQLTSIIAKAINVQKVAKFP